MALVDTVKRYLGNLGYWIQPEDKARKNKEMALASINKFTNESPVFNNTFGIAPGAKIPIQMASNILYGKNPVYDSPKASSYPNKDAYIRALANDPGMQSLGMMVAGDLNPVAGPLTSIGMKNISDYIKGQSPGQETLPGIPQPTIKGYTQLRGKADAGEITPKQGSFTYKSAADALNDPEFIARQQSAMEKMHLPALPKSKNLYHTTPTENIFSIAKSGITSGNPSRFEGVSGKGNISLSANEAAANYYAGGNDVLLRTKAGYTPTNLESDLLAGGDGVYTTTQNIPPKYLEVKINGLWKPLLKVNLDKFFPK